MKFLPIAERHVLEHALQLGGELAAALRLQLADHHLLGVVRGRLLVEEAARQVALVVLLEGILLLKCGSEGGQGTITTISTVQGQPKGQELYFVGFHLVVLLSAQLYLRR